MDQGSSNGGTAARRGVVRRLLPLLILIAGLVLFFALGLDRYLSFRALADNRDWLMVQVRDHAGLSALAFIATYAAVAAFSIPGGAVLTILGGFLFGTVLGTVYAVGGATVGSVALFLAARTALADTLRHKAGGAVQKMRAGFQENALSYLLVLRLIPIFPFWLVNLVPALVGVPLGTYVFGTFVGIVPGTLVYASVGAGVDSLLAAGDKIGFADLFNWQIVLALSGLIVLSLLPVIYKTWRRRGPGGGPGATP